jgi:hypothetical protein
MKLFNLLFLILFSLAACNSSDNESSGEAVENPAEIHPPAEAVPDSLSIVNDSAIMADTTKTNKASGDTLRGNP